MRGAVVSNGAHHNTHCRARDLGRASGTRPSAVVSTPRPGPFGHGPVESIAGCLRGGIRAAGCKRENWTGTTYRPGFPTRILRARRFSITWEGRPFVRYPTPNASSTSVKVCWLNRKETVQRLTTAMKGLRMRHPEIDRAVLFGSLQRGDAVPGSDAVVLIVVAATDVPFPERAAVYRPEGVGVPVDLFVYTGAELKTCWPAATPSSAGRWRRQGPALSLTRDRRRASSLPLP